MNLNTSSNEGKCILSFLAPRGVKTYRAGDAERRRALLVLVPPLTARPVNPLPLCIPLLSCTRPVSALIHRRGPGDWVRLNRFTIVGLGFFLKGPAKVQGLGVRGLI